MTQGVKGTKTMALCHPEREVASRGLCDNCNNRKRRQEGKVRKSTKGENKARYLKSLYGLSIRDYDAMLLEQGGVCALCGLPETRINQHGPTSLAVDHDHETGKPRGLLCHACNSGLGFFREDQALLYAAAAYLTKHSNLGVVA